MVDDIAPELLEKVQSEYRNLRENDSTLARIREKTAAGSADGKDLDAYAVREGELLAEALRNNVSGEALPNGKMYFNIANRVLPPVLQEDYGHVADIAERTQQSMNDKAGIHIRAQRPDLEEDRVKGLVNLAATADQYENIRKELEGDVVNFSQNVATNSVRKNADFQYKAGLSPKIVRTEAAGCCKWCSDLAGTYDYASVKATGNAVWQRHRGCGCVVEYDPGNGKRQNAHTKDWRSDENRAKRIQYSQETEAQRLTDNATKVEERKTANLQTEKIDPRQRQANATIKFGVGTTEKRGNTYRQELEQIDYRDAEEAIKFYGNAIRNLPIEHAVIIQRDGKVLHFWADEKSVTPYDVDLKDAYALHNHPASNGIRSFGKDDFVVMQEHPEAAGYYCVNEMFNYSIKPLETIVNISYHDIELDAWDKCDEQNEPDIQHVVMQLLNDRGYAIYERRGLNGEIS